MTPVYLHDAVRTPRGKARADGGLAALRPGQLVAGQVAALERRGSGDARAADALILGCVGQTGAQGGHIALVARLEAGLPDTMPALSINNYCTSGLTAIGMAAAQIAAGQAGHVLAGGVEMMSRVPFMGDRADYYTDAALPADRRYIPVVLAADRLADALGIGRDELDAVALMSQQRAAAAEHDPRLNASRVATAGLAREECIRPATTAEALAALPPAFGALQDDYAEALEGRRFAPRHTLGHAPPVCDGAALALLSGDGGGRPRARILAYAEGAASPAAGLTGGLDAMARALSRAGLDLRDIERIEFMEAFAVTAALFLRDRRVDPGRVNVGGGHIAKGHPLGASGAILLSSLLDSLDHGGASLGMVVTSGASGVGAAMIVQRLNPGPDSDD
ncbi:acetyl-CoA C-acyltransferase [Sphingomonas changnyeongensis]|uniref:Acetyl-CoA C-acyltransferase n=1 Tax=Sphingomonas changnyeongensis TaxID=2698679 RepID=A0A7Z2NXK3_9SPHN|nr:acetyl-CoA C-acyltransferase [Sphingomonas changnyeongensis]QHL91225.1 acetyl-CoA C-acyltransferase [Sphingomonas changnyeongensis]